MSASPKKARSRLERRAAVVWQNVYELSRLGYLQSLAKTAGRQDVVFLWIPKTAGTSLFKMLDCPLYHTLQGVKCGFPQRGTVTFGHMDYARLIEEGHVSRDFAGRAFTFAVVRDPYDRVISLYHYLREMNRVKGDLSFQEFIQGIHDGRVNDIGIHNGKGWSHCNPQVRWMKDVRVDRIIRFEELSGEMPDLGERIGIPGLTLPHLNKSGRDRTIDYFEDPEVLQIVSDFYKEDFEAFGYPMRG